MQQTYQIQLIYYNKLISKTYCQNFAKKNMRKAYSYASKNFTFYATGSSFLYK